MTYLAKIYDEDLLVCREEQKNDNEDEEEFIGEQPITSVQETGTQPLLEMTNNASATGQFIIPQTEVSQVLPQGVFLIPVAMQEPNNNVEQQQEELPSTNDVLENHQLNEELEKCSSVSEVADLEQCVGLDKSDYVLEIYKVLEDGTQTVVSESTAADEEDQIRDLEEFQVEEELSSQFDNNDDDPYVDVDSLVSGETNDTEFYATRKRRRMDSSTASVITIDNNVKVFSCTECSEIFTCAKEFKHHRYII